MTTPTDAMIARMQKDKPKKEASRMNAGKAEWDYIFDFPTAVEAFCRVKELGAIKYERDNWKAGGKPDREYISAVGRHISAFKQGETFATDTGCLHLAHAMWNVMALIELNYPGVTHDPELFAKMSEHWAEVKRRKTPVTQGRTRSANSGGWVEPLPLPAVAGGHSVSDEALRQQEADDEHRVDSERAECPTKRADA